VTSPGSQSLYQALLLLALSAAADVSMARTPLLSSLQRACSTAIEERIELLPVQGKRVSACPQGNDEGCPYSAREGKTFLDDTPDLNNDGRADAILTYFGSSYGGIDVTDKLILAQCADGTYIRLLEGRFTTLTALSRRMLPGQHWTRHGTAQLAKTAPSVPRRSSCSSTRRRCGIAVQQALT